MFQYFPVDPGKGYTLDLAFFTVSVRNFCNVPYLHSLVPVEANHHNAEYFKVELNEIQ